MGGLQRLPYLKYYNVLKLAIFKALSSVPVGDRHMHARLFCTKLNPEQLLFEAIFDTCVFLAASSPNVNLICRDRHMLPLAFLYKIESLTTFI